MNGNGDMSKTKYKLISIIKQENYSNIVYPSFSLIYIFGKSFFVFIVLGICALLQH